MGSTNQYDFVSRNATHTLQTFASMFVLHNVRRESMINEQFMKTESFCDQKCKSHSVAEIRS